MIALLYALRWKIEKAYDMFKSKLHQRKAWATGATAAHTQAHLIALTHNLLTILLYQLNATGLTEGKMLTRSRDAKTKTKTQTPAARRAPAREKVRHAVQLTCQFKRLLAYQTLLYTGQRKSEVRALVWSDLHLEGDKPHALFRAGTMKDKDKRAVPLRRELAAALLASRPADFDPTQRVFWFCWPTYDILKGDLKRAGIVRKDGLGRVVHFHSFRKTLQTLGVGCGMNQRAAQEILGHTDANLTARVYTDVPSLELHREIDKLPWVSPAGIVAQHGAQKSGVSRLSASLPDIFTQLVEAVKVTDAQGLSHALASYVTSLHSGEMAARAGIEPVTK